MVISTPRKRWNSQLALALALLIPVAIEGRLIAEAIPEVLISSERLNERLNYYLNKGREDLDLGNYDSALDNFNKTIELDPTVWQAYHNRAIIKFDRKDFSGAFVDYTKAIELNSDGFYWSFYNRGLISFKLEDWRGAIDDYSKAIELNSANDLAYHNRAYSKQKLNDYEGAIDDYSKAIALEPEEAHYYSSRGYSKQKLNNHQGVIDDYSKAIELDPNKAYYYSSRAYSKQKLGDFDGAIDDYSKAIELNPKNAYYYSSRGYIQAELKEYKKAIDDFSKAIELEPEEAYYYHIRGYCKGRLKDHQGAIDDFSKAIELDPEDAYYYSSRGSNKSSLGDNQGAIDDYSKAIELNPNENQYYMFRGNQKRISGDYQGAIDDYSKAIELNPKNDLAYDNRGYTKTLLKDFDGAIKDHSIAIKLNPSNSGSYDNRAYAKILLKDFEGAIKDHSKAILINPEVAYSYQSRGYSKQKLGDFDGAIIDYEKVVEIGDEEEIVRSMGDLMFLYFYNDDYREIPSLIEKLKLKTSYKKGQEKYSSAIILYNQARLNVIYGNEIEAIKLLEESIRILSILNKDNDYYAEISRELLIALYTDKKQFNKAKKIIKPKTLNGQIALANIAFRQDEFLKAEKIIKRLYNIQVNQSEDENDDPTLIGLLGSAYWWQGKNQKALPLLEESLNRYKKLYGQTSPMLIQPLLNLAMAHFNNQDYEKTDYYLRRSLRIQFIQIQEKAPYIPLSQRNNFVKTLGISYAAIFSASNIHPSGKDLAFFARLNRHGLLEEIERRQSQFASLDGPQLEVLERIKKITNILASKSGVDSQRISELNNEKEILELRLYRLLPEMKVRIIETSDIAKAIPSNGVLIEFQRFKPFNFDKTDDALDVKNWGEARYQAFLLKQNGKIESVDLGLAAPIEEKIQQALIASEKRLADAQDLWRQVGALVINPLSKAIGDATTLFVSPDAELNRIPFAALNSYKDDQLLSDVFDLRLLTTGRELLELSKQVKSTKQKSLVVANPAFNLIKEFPRKQQLDLIASNAFQQRSGDLGSLTWSPLPGTAKEGKLIAQLTKAQLLTFDKATALAVQQKEAPKVLHIATHAFFRPIQKSEQDGIASLFLNASDVKSSEKENPLLRSGIVLAGANEPEANPKDDGYLTALEVTKLDWQGTEMVVVSGCESGKGDIQSGEGVYGLKRAIAVAGARSSLLSLWKVDDRATAAFMTSFYKKLKAGEGRADALAATQKEFRNHSITGWRHPYYWAAFQLSGDWRPIDF